MTYTLTVSSQGQMIIPKEVRKKLGLKPKDKVTLQINPKSKIPSATIEPTNFSWVDRVAGTAKGIYGNVEEYIENERNSWDL